MATRTFTRLYDSHDDAVQVVNDLEAAGIPASDISLVASNRDNRYPGTDVDSTPGGTGAGAGATVGTVLGGGAGLLAGIGSLAIPGVGPIVAAGWLIATITGAGVGAAVGGAAGGLIGGLTSAGVSEDEAHVYAEGVRRGGSLITVRADDPQAARVESILGQRSYVDTAARRQEYEEGGWSRFDETAEPYAPTLSVDPLDRP
ncbi:MAG: hypothetical protein JO264_19925 [Acidisphaera sp.]|nr:hypothetical protein [Acidisphaera sp.]